MKQRDVLKGIMLPLAVILAVVLFGCEPKPIYPSETSSINEEVIIGLDGGVVTAMDGDVVITIPAGALTEPARFFVHEAMNKSARNYALKTIVIEPLVVFKTPVQLTLKYDGCLGTGINLCEAKSVLFSVWDDEAAFIQQKTPIVCLCCNVNDELHTVCMSICQTGVIATTAEW